MFLVEVSMKIKLLLVLTVIVIAAASCSSPAENILGDEAPVVSSQVENPEGFTASASSSVTVDLGWEPVEGATGYWLELKLNDDVYLPVAQISPAFTSYQLFPAPDGSDLTFRLRTLTAEGQSNGVETTISTPVQEPNPLPVQAAFSESSHQNAVIGPEGGSLELTDDNGIFYSLLIPAGALQTETEMGLTAVTQLTGLDFEGGLLAAVRIEPEGLEFDFPASLVITLPADLPEDGLLTAAFAFGGEGEDFHLQSAVVPGSGTAFMGAAGSIISSTFRLLSPVFQSRAKVIEIPVRDAKTNGIGRLSNDRLRKQVVDYSPRTPKHRVQQNLTPELFLDEEIAVLDYSAVTSVGTTLLKQTLAIDNWSGLQNVLRQTEIWWETLESERNGGKSNSNWDKLEQLILDELGLNVKVYMEKAASECTKSPNLGEAKKLVNRLVNAGNKGDGMRQNTFYQKMSQMLVEKHSANYLKDLKAKLDKCQLSFDAHGQLGDTTVTGKICDLSKPFTLNGVAAGGIATMTFTFTPASDAGGTFSLTGGGAGFTISGSGTYSVIKNGGMPSKLQVITQGSVDIGTGGNSTDTVDLFVMQGACQ